MKVIYLESEGQDMPPVVLHWVGPGWYGPVQREVVVHEYFITDASESRAIAEARLAGLGTPHQMSSPDNY